MLAPTITACEEVARPAATYIVVRIFFMVGSFSGPLSGQNRPTAGGCSKSQHCAGIGITGIFGPDKAAAGPAVALRAMAGLVQWLSSQARRNPPSSRKSETSAFARRAAARQDGEVRKKAAVGAAALKMKCRA
jgi:hypothetical protein